VESGSCSSSAVLCPGCPRNPHPRQTTHLLSHLGTHSSPPTPTTSTACTCCFASTALSSRRSEPSPSPSPLPPPLPPPPATAAATAATAATTTIDYLDPRCALQASAQAFPSALLAFTVWHYASDPDSESGNVSQAVSEIHGALPHLATPPCRVMQLHIAPPTYHHSGSAFSSLWGFSRCFVPR